MQTIKNFLSEKTFHVSQNDIKDVNKKLVQYISSNIYPYYDKFDQGHNRKHLFRVVKHSLLLAKKLKVNINMCYVIAVYHDIGLVKKNRDLHHKISSDMLINDKNLKQWFNEKEIQIMADAVYDHRASAKKPPRTIYGKIVADADKSYIKLEYMIERSIGHHLHNGTKGPNLFNEVYSHIKNKFGKNGYAKYWLQETKQLLQKDISYNHSVIEDANKFKKLYEKVAKNIFNLDKHEIYQLSKKG